LKLLTSDSNPLFRRWLRLASSPRAVRELGQTLAEGLHLAQAIVQSQWPVIAALVRRGAHEETIDGALAQLPAQTACFQLPALLYDRISPVERGIGLTLLIPAAAATPPTASREDLIYWMRSRTPSTSVRCCEPRPPPESRMHCAARRRPPPGRPGPCARPWARISA